MNVIKDKEACLDYIRSAEGRDLDLSTIGENLKYDKDVVVALIKKNQYLINDLSTQLIEGSHIGYSDSLLTAVFENLGAELYDRISPELKKNPNFMLKVMESYPKTAFYLKDLCPELSNDINFLAKCDASLKEVADRYKNKNKFYSDFVVSANEELNKNLEKCAKDTFGLDKEKTNIVKNYPKTLQNLSDIVKSDKGEIFKECIKNVSEKDLEIVEWSESVNNLVDRFKDTNYNELLSNVNKENVNVNDLNNVLSQPNYFNIKTSEDVKNYEKIKTEVCDKIMSNDEKAIEDYPVIANSFNIKDKLNKIKFCVLQKLFNYDIKKAESVAYKFPDVKDTKSNSSLNSYVACLNSVLKEENPNKLKQFYSLEPLKKEDSLEKSLKNLYLDEYNNTLFKAENGAVIDSSNMEKYMPEGFDKSKYKFVDAGVDFNMIMTAMGAHRTANTDNGYYESWNRDITTSQGMSCSYIGNDMIATAPIRNVCYGFSEMGKNSLLLSGPGNLGVAVNEEVLNFPKSGTYYTPEHQKCNTEYYNEMYFSRVQEGKRKQPDYMIVFKRGENVDYMKETLTAVDDFAKKGVQLPIVVVDVDRCIENEKNKINDMLTNARETGSKEDLEAAYWKIKCNQHTDNKAFEEYLDKYYDEKSNMQNIENKSNIEIGEQTYENSYNNTTVLDRKNEIDKLVRLQKEMTRDTNTKENEYTERA